MAGQLYTIEDVLGSLEMCSMELKRAYKVLEWLCDNEEDKKRAFGYSKYLGPIKALCDDVLDIRKGLLKESSR